MINIDKIDEELYCSFYIVPNIGDYNKIWSSIKSDLNVLRKAIEIKRNKWDSADILNGPTIANFMLLDYENIDKKVYDELINYIYTNKAIARLVVDGASNGGYSFLLLSLSNDNLKLTEEQKQFAVNEAMNKIGTTRYKKIQEDYSCMLEKMGIDDSITVNIDIDGCISPIGLKTKNEYFSYIFSSLSDTQAHGCGAFDIRYYILRNPNWSIEEKQKLVMDFWYDDKVYETYLNDWEWSIVNDSVNYNNDNILLFPKDDLYDYSYNLLLRFYGDEKIADRIWKEIEFCRLMHDLRPQQWEKEFKNNKKVLSFK